MTIRMPTLQRLRRNLSGVPRAVFGVLALIMLTLGGAFGYIAIEGMRFSDALFMTVITLSTVGYGEVQPLSDAGRWYTMALIAFGVGVVFYTIVEFAAFLMEGRLRTFRLRRSTMRSIDALRNHIVICGFGRLGRAVAEQLAASKADFVVVDPDPAALAECEARGWLCVAGSALDDEILATAGVVHARALVAAIASDADNVFGARPQPRTTGARACRDPPKACDGCDRPAPRR